MSNRCSCSPIHPLTDRPPLTAAALGLSSYPIGHRLPAGLDVRVESSTPNRATGERKAGDSSYYPPATGTGSSTAPRLKNYPRTRVDAPTFSAIVIL